MTFFLFDFDNTSLNIECLYLFQSLLMFAAIYSVIISAWVDKGSLSEIWRIAEENGRIEFWK